MNPPEYWKTENWDPQLRKDDLGRWSKIHVGGPVLKILLEGWSASGASTLSKFMRSLNIDPQVDEISSQALENFFQSPAGVMILNHPNNNFADYIPLLSRVSEENLKKTYFLSVKETSPMFKREFPELANNFVAATGSSRKNASKLREVMDKVQKGEGYIFMIPGMTGEQENDDTKIAQRTFESLLKGLPKSTPLLASNIEYSTEISYGDVYTRAFRSKVGETLGLGGGKLDVITPTLQSRNILMNIFHGCDESQMKAIYKNLFETN